jgi:hypothetical protein
MKNIKLNQCIICFFAFLIIAILIYKIITIEKFQTSTSQSTTNEVNYSPDNNQFGVNGINKINLTQPGVYVIARPNETIDLSLIDGIDTYDYIIRLRNRAENNSYDLSVNDTLIIKSDRITVIGNSTISEETPINVPDKWTGFITDKIHTVYAYDFDNLVFKNIHIQCLKDRSLADSNSCSRINYNEYGSLVSFNKYNNGGIFKHFFGYASQNLEFENLSFKGNIGASYSNEIACEDNDKLRAQDCGGIFGEMACSHAVDVYLNNLKFIGDIYGDTCGGIFGEDACFYGKKININNLETNGNIYGDYCGGIFAKNALYRINKYNPNTFNIIKNLTFNGNIYGDYCGGIFAGDAFYEANETNLNNLKFNGNIYGYNCGGIFGWRSFMDTSNLNITNLNFNGNIYGEIGGGIFGSQVFTFSNKIPNNIKISNCVSESTIYGKRGGGIFSAFSFSPVKKFNQINPIEIKNCIFKGIIIGHESAGIIGYFSIQNLKINLINCHSYCDIISVESSPNSNSNNLNNAYFCSGIICNNSIKKGSSVNIINCSYEGNINGNNCGGIIGNSCGDSDSNIVVKNSFCKGSFDINVCRYNDIVDSSTCNQFKSINDLLYKGLHEGNNYILGDNNGAFCAGECMNITFNNCYSHFVSNINIKQLQNITFTNSCFLASTCKNIQINNCFVISNLISNNNIFAFYSDYCENIAIKNSLFKSNNSLNMNYSNAISSKAIQKNTFLDVGFNDQLTFENVYSFSSMNEFRKLAERTILVDVPQDTWYLCSTPWKLMWEAQLDKAKETSLSTNPVIDNSVTLPSLENCEPLGLNIRCSSTQN